MKGQHFIQDGWKKEERVHVKVLVDAELLGRIIRLGIHPSEIAEKAFADAVKKRERELELKAVQAKDPRVTEADLRSRSVRIRRLRGL
jgi:hypothetical protein